MQSNGTRSLDPADWQEFRRQAHAMLDESLAYLEEIQGDPVWQPVPDAVREQFRSPLPREGSSLASVHNVFRRDIRPYGSGNVHPGFLGWVQGGGTPVGMLAEMLAAGMNSNLGGRDHAPAEVERQVVEWVRDIFGFPRGSTGLFVTGTSMANLTAAAVARDAMPVGSTRLTAYASAVVHGCVAKALDVIGVGRGALRSIRTDALHRIDIEELKSAIEADRRHGFTPFLIVGTAGTVDIGATDDLDSLADVACEQRLWFHVDGAYAALGMLAPDIAPRLKGIERADSLAFDFHKWGQVPYAAGFLLVRHGTLHQNAFARSASYLNREGRGLAAGSPWPCDFGVDLSRGFQALKTWFTLKVYGTKALGEIISQTCRLARYLEELILGSAELELMAPVQLNIVCFRFRAVQADRVNAKIVVDLQEAGDVAPSTTMLNGRLVIRAAIVNHRTTEREMDLLVEKTLSLGRAIEAKISQTTLAEWVPCHLREAGLEDLNRQLAGHPEQVELRVQRADLLASLGRISDARDEYLAALLQQPTHRIALNNLGAVLYGTGHRKAARTAYAEAVAQHPRDAMSRVNLANVLVEEGDLPAARGHYEAVLRFQDGDDPQRKASQGLARVLAELGEEKAATEHRNAGFVSDWLTVLPYRGRERPLSMLLLVSAEGGNLPIRHLLDDSVFQLSVVMADYYDERQALPPHQLVFNSIGDADLAGKALLGAEAVLAHSAAPVINPVGAVRMTGRVNNARRLRGIPGVIAPVTVMMPRESLEPRSAGKTLALHGLGFPLLLRAPRFHTGRHFVKVESAAELATGLAGLPGQDVIVMQYLDARGRDGKSRKYRVMMIDGHLYPLHVAISSHWKIHYFTAEMSNCAVHREEDAAFLKDMPGLLGALAMNALSSIQQVLGLDYAGIDFGLNEAGEVLLFETNATMVVLPPEAKPQWDYRRPAVERVHRAVLRMIGDRSGVRR